ncbi:hypothetical protein [Sphingomonas morindae]|uniref:Uncharacterized protein n=1 Tax=Sphingomonas morindae TaxID=1541170 RepID=A0ABY4X801_9SPHN|nr:hypothetical protein [Sphingomonas morindae]USI73031.1 hypothetical protein LHA26_00700 [Sphingomonas morindae]
MAETLPEGTDHVVPGATATTPSPAPDATPASPGDRLNSDTESTGGRFNAEDLRGKAQAKAEELRAQAGDAVRDYAEQGKARAADALHQFAQLITDNAGQLDEKAGGQFGDYARRAADAVSGAADSLRERDIQEFLEDARGLVRRSPALALSAAAAAGFLLARVVKAGSEALEAQAGAIDPAKPVGTGTGAAPTPGAFDKL